MKRLSLFVLALLAFSLMGCPLFFGQVATPEFSPPDGTDLSSSGAIQVTITCATPKASIHYTLDGSTPTESSTLYVGPITITPDHMPPDVIKAIGTSRFRPDSEVATASYTWGW